MTKVIKLKLYYMNDDILEYKKAQEALWNIQHEVRAASNRAIQMCWEYNNFESDWKKRLGEYPTTEEKNKILGKSLSGVIYNKVRQELSDSNSCNISCTLQAVCGKFNSMKKDIYCGKTSVPTYRSNLPIDVHNRNIVLDYKADENGGVTDWFVSLSLFSRSGAKKLGLPSGVLRFKAVVPGRSRKFITPFLERCYDGEYKICGSKLAYDGGKWFLLLCFSFESAKNVVSLDKNNIMGVHIAKFNAVTCTFSDNDKKLSISGGEIAAFAAQIEKRKRDIGNASRKHSKLCGDGRINHGYHAKMKPLDNIGNKISKFRNTVNHRYSRQIIDWAVQNNCGTIQIEDLTGFASDEPLKYKLLGNWSYFDLQNKIESKAKEYGITVVKVGYALLKRWCPDCKSPTVKKCSGENDSERYVCSVCGETFDPDLLGEHAIAVPNITELVQTKKDK